MKNMNAEKWLEMAIKRHERHMNGSEPVSGKEGEISQMLMMDEMKNAMKALMRDEEVESSSWYDDNMDKVKKGKKMDM
jgi:hypothetical protein